VAQKNSQNCFWHNFVKFKPTLTIFGIKMAKPILLCMMHSFTPHLIYVNTLPCETQMLQIVTLYSDYLYQIAHLCVIRQRVRRGLIILKY